MTQITYLSSVVTNILCSFGVPLTYSPNALSVVSIHFSTLPFHAQDHLCSSCLVFYSFHHLHFLFCVLHVSPGLMWTCFYQVATLRMYGMCRILGVWFQPLPPAKDVVWCHGAAGYRCLADPPPPPKWINKRKKEKKKPNKQTKRKAKTEEQCGWESDLHAIVLWGTSFWCIW